MKRAGLCALFLACGVAGACLAVVLAGPIPASVFTTGTSATSGATTTTLPPTTSAPPPTTTAPPTTTTAPPPPPPPPRPPRTIAAGVTIGGVAVGNLRRASAVAVVRSAFATPLLLVFGAHTLRPAPAQLGATASVLRAVDRALRARPRTAVPLRVRVRTARVEAYLAKLAQRFDRRPVDSRLFLRDLRPFLTKNVSGRSLRRAEARMAIVRSLVTSRRGRIRLRAAEVKAAVTRRSFGPVIVIRRGTNRLHLYEGMRERRVFGVATGETRYPTPLGRFAIVVKWRNPWWYPPDSDWAKDEKPVPPGPGNPLGTRWMGISAPAVGIHGTPDSASIGYSVSHGCIRMQIPDAEWLFERVSIGTPVFIVSA